MKNLTLFLLLLLSANKTFADCSNEGMRFFPLKKEISLNPMFIIEGYQNSQVTINSFKNRKIYLKTENGVLVELTLVEILKGYTITQAVFKLSAALQPNTKYHLYYSDQTDREKREMMEYNSVTRERELVYWQTTNLDEEKDLTPDVKIAYSKNEINSYGCGDAVNSIYNVSTKNDAEIWYKTELIEIATDIKTVMYLTEKEGELLYVGKGMCGGAFAYKNKQKYKIRFTPTNADGKQLATTNWIEFKSPYDTEKGFWMRN